MATNVKRTVEATIISYRRPSPKGFLALVEMDLPGVNGTTVRYRSRLDLGKQWFLDVPADPIAAATLRLLAPEVTALITAARQSA